MWRALSSLGRSIYLPQGIFYWSGRAAKEAEINGTIGIAQDDDGTISHLASAEIWAGHKIMERLPKAKVFGYAPIQGVLSLRQKWFSYIAREHPSCEKFSSLPIVVNGITHGIAVVSRLFLDAGQTVVTADKSWENYEHIFSGIQGVKMSYFKLFDKNGGFNIHDCIKIYRGVAETQGKAVLLLNFPHNQTGFMPSETDTKTLGNEIKNLCKSMPSANFVVLLDDAYEGYVYDGVGQKKSLLSEIFEPLPNLTVVKMDGISKMMLAYGYRVAFLTFFSNTADAKLFSEEIDIKVGGLIRGEISQVNHHGQILADALMDNYNLTVHERAQVIERLKERWKVMMHAFNENYKKYGREHMWMDPCNSGFFCYVNLADGIDPKQIAERLIKEKRVGIVPSGQGLRVAFCGVAKDKIQKMVDAIFETVC